jgi:hypothetical protein
VSLTSAVEAQMISGDKIKDDLPPENKAMFYIFHQKILSTFGIIKCAGSALKRPGHEAYYSTLFISVVHI